MISEKVLFTKIEEWSRQTPEDRKDTQKQYNRPLSDSPLR